MTPQRLITRAEWGAREQDGAGDRPLPISEWWLHHSVTIAPDLVPPFDDDDAAVRTLEQIGEQRFSTGISYTFPVTPVGRCYQGHSMDRRGSHTKGHNTVGAAFVLVGDHTHRAPTTAQEVAIASRMVIEHREGNALTHQLNGGHRDVSETSCPGDAAYRRIDAINTRARQLWAAGYPQEDDMPTASEVADELLKRPVYDRDGTKITVGVALGRTLRNSGAGAEAARDAARDAAVARALAEAGATSASPLTDADVARIAAETVAAVDAHLDARDRALAEALAAAGEEQA